MNNLTKYLKTTIIHINQLLIFHLKGINKIKKIKNKKITCSGGGGGGGGASGYHTP